MIDHETAGTIVRLFEAEKWPKGTIAAHLGVHHSVVTRVLEQAASQPCQAAPRRSKLDPYLPFILDTLRRYPKLRASRLLAMCRERGYVGGPSHFRDVVRRHRPRPKAEAYLRLRMLPGEQGQVDWAHFGKVRIDAALRVLTAFVMVLAYSRRVFVRFFLGMQTENFLRGHEAAFAAFGGCPRIALYDNLKSCVLERRGEVIRFHPLMTAFAAHYRFELRPVAVARGNEKGRVERAIRYVRDAFFAGRQFRDVDDLNQQADAWCDGPALDRPWPDDHRLTVRQAFASEQSRLVSLPANPFPVDERREVVIGKTPYARFDLNDYSVPHEHVRKTLVVMASLDTVRVLDGQVAVATHKRSYGKREQIEDPVHIERLVADKHLSHQQRGVDLLHRAVPSAQAMLVTMVERGENLGSATKQLLQLLDRFSAAALEAAIKQAIDKGAPHPHAVRHILEQEQRRDGAAPRVAPTLPDDPRVRDIVVKPHALATYDSLANTAAAPGPTGTDTSAEQEVHDEQA